MSVRAVDPARSRIVLVGSPAYDDPQLPDVPVVANNIAGFAAVLTDPDLGGFDPAHCAVAPPRAGMADIGDLLVTAAAEAEDLLLFYYSGHGLLEPLRSELYLSLAATRRDRLAFTALAFDAVRDACLTSGASSRVVILDSCFSGRAIGDTLAGDDEDVLGQLQVAGTYTLTSAPANRSALILPGEVHTAFTGRLLRLLRDGIPGAGPVVRLGDVYRNLRVELQAAGLPAPQQRGTETAELLGLVRNRHRLKNQNVLRPASSTEWRPAGTMTGHRGRVLSLDISPDGSLLASSGAAKDHSVRLWSTTSQHHVATLTGHQQRVHSVRFSPDGVHVASCGDDGRLLLWDIHTGQLLKTYRDRGSPLNALAFSPDGAMLAAASDAGVVELWDVTHATLQATLSGHVGPVRALDFGGDGRTIASASDDSTARLWDLSTGAATRMLAEHSGTVFGVRFSPDGQTLATCGIDRTVRLWDTGSGACKTILKGHADSARSVAFSPSGDVIASGGDDGSVRFWEVETAKPVGTLLGHTGFPTRWVMWVEFHPTGDVLASCGHDRTIRWWRSMPSSTD